MSYGYESNRPVCHLFTVTSLPAVYGAMEKEGGKLVGGNAATAGLPLSVAPIAARVFKY